MDTHVEWQTGLQTVRLFHVAQPFKALIIFTESFLQLAVNVGKQRIRDRFTNKKRQKKRQARREEQARRAAEEAQRQELLLPEDPPEPEYDMERD